MDTKDLRKGNWLILTQEGNGGEAKEQCVQVDHIDGDSINDIAKTYYRPKPITPDVLRQIGFSEDEQANELEMTFLRFTVGDIPHYRLKARREKAGEGYSVSLFLGDNQLWPWINTVHELQNYYFVQSGQEMELAFGN